MGAQCQQIRAGPSVAHARSAHEQKRVPNMVPPGSKPSTVTTDALTVTTSDAKSFNYQLSDQPPTRRVQRRVQLTSRAQDARPPAPKNNVSASGILATTPPRMVYGSCAAPLEPTFKGLQNKVPNCQTQQVLPQIQCHFYTRKFRTCTRLMPV